MDPARQATDSVEESLKRADLAAGPPEQQSDCRRPWVTRERGGPSHGRLDSAGAASGCTALSGAVHGGRTCTYAMGRRAGEEQSRRAESARGADPQEAVASGDGPQSSTMPPPSLASGGFLPGALHKSNGRRDGSGHGGTGSARSAGVGLHQQGRPGRQA
jgi:hypothetical protein